MSLTFPSRHVASIHTLGARLLESRKPGTELRKLARDLLTGWFDICLRAGLDGLLVELQLDVADWSTLADHAQYAPALAAQLETIDLDGGGPRNQKPRQLADCVIAALGLTVADEPDTAITLDADLRAQVATALASAIDAELAAPRIRETIIAMARERCDDSVHGTFTKIVAQLDDRGLQLIKQPKVPIDQSQAVQRALSEARTALVARIAAAGLDRAVPVIARVDAEAAARIDRPVTLRLTPREIAIARANDPRVPKTPAAVIAAVIDGFSETARIAWRAPAQTVHTYAASKTFSIGDVIEHPKFGRGTVASMLEQRIDVEFADGKRTLVHVAAPK